MHRHLAAMVALNSVLTSLSVAPPPAVHADGSAGDTDGADRRSSEEADWVKGKRALGDAIAAASASSALLVLSFETSGVAYTLDAVSQTRWDLSAVPLDDGDTHLLAGMLRRHRHLLVLLTPPYCEDRVGPKATTVLADAVLASRTLERLNASPVGELRNDTLADGAMGDWFLLCHRARELWQSLMPDGAELAKRLSRCEVMVVGTYLEKSCRMDSALLNVQPSTKSCGAPCYVAEYPPADTWA